MKKNIKLSLYLKFIGIIPKVEVNGLTLLNIVDNTCVYSDNIDSSKIYNLLVSVKNIENGSAVIIDKIILGDIHLVHLDFFGIYRTNAGTKKTYGYMDEEGIYKFKIRYNALSLNYLSNILAKIT